METIQKYKTVDGVIFDDEALAIKHETVLDMLKVIKVSIYNKNIIMQVNTRKNIDLFMFVDKEVSDEDIDIRIESIIGPRKEITYSRDGDDVWKICYDYEKTITQKLCEYIKEVTHLLCINKDTSSARFNDYTTFAKELKLKVIDSSLIKDCYDRIEEAVYSNFNDIFIEYISNKGEDLDD